MKLIQIEQALKFLLSVPTIRRFFKHFQYKTKSVFLLSLLFFHINIRFNDKLFINTFYMEKIILQKYLLSSFCISRYLFTQQNFIHALIYHKCATHLFINSARDSGVVTTIIMLSYWERICYYIFLYSTQNSLKYKMIDEENVFYYEHRFYDFSKKILIVYLSQSV